MYTVRYDFQDGNAFKQQYRQFLDVVDDVDIWLQNPNTIKIIINVEK